MSREQEAFDYFVSQGWTGAQAAGIVGNLKVESGLDPSVYGDNGKAYGIAQWHPDRQSAFLLKTGKTLQQSTFQDQLAFVHYELTNGSEKTAGAALKNASTASDAATVFASQYERPASKDYSSRINAATSLLSSAGTTALSGVSELYDAVRSGKTVTLDMLTKVFSAPATAAGSVVGGAVTGVGESIGGVLNFDLGSWLSNQLTGAVWDGLKDKLVPIGVGVIAALLVALSVWGMVKDTPVGGAVKSASKIAALA